MLSPKEVVNKWVDAFNAGDVDAIVGLYDEGATNHQVANEPVIGCFSWWCPLFSCVGRCMVSYLES